MQLTYAGQTFDIHMMASCKHASDIIIGGISPKKRPVMYDVETNGLHAKASKPFAGAFCVYRTVYLYPINEQLKLHGLKELADHMTKIVAHNCLFEMNMTANVMKGKYVVSIKNWSDSIFTLRLTSEALAPDDGGDKLALKDWSVKYIDKDANKYEKLLKAQLSKIQKINPDATYADVDPEILWPYLATDVILQQLALEMRSEELVNREQEIVLQREERALYPAFKMQRIGMKANRPYLIESKKRVVAYIEKLYAELKTLGFPFTVNQHKKIKEEYYTQLLGYTPPSTDKYFIRDRLKQGDRVAALIARLRSLEKWNTTYIDNLLRGSEYDGRIYPSLNPSGTVTGRYSSDFQQMPRGQLVTEEGEAYFKIHEEYLDEHLLFNPRRAIESEPEDGYYLFSLDFSQEELRFQAHYTMPFGGDLKLCRAYIPFRCVHYETGEIFNFLDPIERFRWLEMREDTPEGYWEDLLAAGHSAWIVPETKQPWKPTDVHGSTSKEALNILQIPLESLGKDGELDWKAWRGIGKSYNFMKIYGGSPRKTAEVLDIEIHVAEAMDNGFLESFPLVRRYMKKVQEDFVLRGYTTNLFQRRYYIRNHRDFYKGANYKIQGGCGDFLKEVMIRVDDYLTENRYRSYMVLPVHDEIIYRIHISELHIIPKLIEFMQDCPKLLIPLLTEPDIILETWDKKTAYTPEVEKELLANVNIKNKIAV